MHWQACDLSRPHPWIGFVSSRDRTTIVTKGGPGDLHSSAHLDLICLFFWLFFDFQATEIKHGISHDVLGALQHQYINIYPLELVFSWRWP